MMRINFQDDKWDKWFKENLQDDKWFKENLGFGCWQWCANHGRRRRHAAILKDENGFYDPSILSNNGRELFRAPMPFDSLAKAKKWSEDLIGTHGVAARKIAETIYALDRGRP